MSELKTPWMEHYGDVRFHLEYPKTTMAQQVLKTASENPDEVAIAYMGKNIKYKELASRIQSTAKAFVALGVKPDEMVTICLPNCPQAVYAMYALNLIGAIASMIHPLSSEGEITQYLDQVSSKVAITLDLFKYKFDEVVKRHPLEHLIICSAVDELNPVTKVGYSALMAVKKKTVHLDKTESTVITWKDFSKGAESVSNYKKSEKTAYETAIILFSGGTTGTTKGIMLSSYNFNALAYQTLEMAHDVDFSMIKVLAAMPIFHGFGLGICIHTFLAIGGTSILVPRFNVKSYAALIKKKKPNYIAGVPTLYEALIRTNYLDGVDLSFLKGVFSGGDSLPIELKKRFDAYLEEHGSKVHVREGYGTTECVTASCLTPYCEEREGSIGLPFPDTYYKICKPGTTEECPYGEEGEICLTGPSLMLGYLNNPEETAQTLRVHEDGATWLHTGDLGIMDKDGFIYFKQRLKRMIITSGYNVYPSQLENIIDAHPAVHMSCVIGVKDSYKMQKIKAFVVLKNGYVASEDIRQQLYDYCKKNIAKYAMPYEIEFRDSLPKTLVGKIAYTVLEKETEEKERMKEELKNQNQAG